VASAELNSSNDSKISHKRKVTEILNCEDVIEINKDSPPPKPKILKQGNIYKAFGIQVQHTMSTGRLVIHKPGIVEEENTPSKYSCQICNRLFTNQGNVANHIKLFHRNNLMEPPEGKKANHNHDGRLKNPGSATRTSYSFQEKFRACATT